MKTTERKSVTIDSTDLKPLIDSMMAQIGGKRIHDATIFDPDFDPHADRPRRPDYSKFGIQLTIECETPLTGPTLTAS
jgi:hypothetical protein